MKCIFHSLLFILSAFTALAQKGQPAFGKIDKADLEMKECDFDKGAGAVTLIDWGNLYYRRGKVLFNAIYEYRVRIKILKESGLSYANVTIPYFDENNEEHIEKVSAITYNLDESGHVKATDAGKSSIFFKRLNKRYSALIIAFPEARTGSVLEYHYTLESQFMGEIKPWYFQGKLPVRYSEYQVNVPAIFHFSVQPSIIDPIDVKEEVTEENMALTEGFAAAKILKKNYVMQKLRGIKDEPYMGSVKDYLQRLDFQLSQIDYGDGQVVDLRRKWSDVVSELLNDKDFGQQLEKNIPGTESLLAEALKQPQPESRARKIFDEVRMAMNWNGDADIYAFEGVGKAWSARSGSSADINLILVNLFRKAGLDAHPVLFSTRDNGLVNRYFPFINQFNTVMACVKLDDAYEVFDGTDKISFFKLTPLSVINTSGFVVNGDKGIWIDATDIIHKYKMMTAVNGVVDTAGVMNGNCLVNSYEYAKNERCAMWLKDKAGFRENYFSRPNGEVIITDLAVNNTGADSLPLEQKLQFHYPLNHSGGYLYFMINLFSGIDDNPFVSEERVSDIEFGHLQDYSVYGSYTIPDGFVFESLPENISLVMPDKSIIFTRYLQAEDNLLHVKMTLNFKSTYYAAKDYPDFSAFYKKLFSMMGDQVVIKRKVPE